MKYDNFDAVDNGKSKIMKYDNFSAVDSGFANITGLVNQPSNYQIVENYVDVYSFDVAPPANIGLPPIINTPIPNAYGLSPAIPSEFLRLVVRMERGLASVPQNANNFTLAKSLWFNQIRPSVVAFMRNAKTPTTVNFLNNKFAQANAQIPLVLPDNIRGFRFTYSLAYMPLNIPTL